MIISLQYLRAVAAMMVVAFHACDKLARTENASDGIAFTVGLAGVDIFFVISGFIIFVTAQRADAGPVSFARKRLVRIVPLYWLLTMALAAVTLVRPDLVSTAAFDLSHFATSLLFIPAPHPQIDAHVPLLIPGWTLNYEMAFYALFAASLFLPKPARLPALLAVITGLALVGFVFPLDGVAGFYTDQIILEFAAGLVIASLWTGGASVNRATASAVMVAGFALLYLASGTDLPRAIGAGLPACLIVAGGVLGERHGHARPIAPLVKLGDASYSIYLSHVLVLPVVALMWNRAGLGGDGAGGAAFVGLTLVVCALAGVVLHELVERPLLRWLGGASRNPRATSPAPRAEVVGATRD